MEILDQEAEDDEAFRETHPVSERPPSHEANTDLVGKEQRYRAVLQQARDSDELVRKKFEEWEENIIQLTWNEVRTRNLIVSTTSLILLPGAQADLEDFIPSSTVASQTQRTSADPVRAHARALRVQLEKLDDLSKSRGEVGARVSRLAGADDITPRILRAAAAMEQWVNVQPAMFEDILDEELAKYDKFRVQLQDDERQQAELLDAVKVSFPSHPSPIPIKASLNLVLLEPES